MFKKSDAPQCPLLKSACIEAKCKFWTRLLGTNPQTGQPIDQFDCAVTWLPILLIETAKEVRQGAAATESFRNEVAKENSSIGLVMKAAALAQVSSTPKERLLPHDA